MSPCGRSVFEKEVSSARESVASDTEGLYWQVVHVLHGNDEDTGLVHRLEQLSHHAEKTPGSR